MIYLLPLGIPLLGAALTPAAALLGSKTRQFWVLLAGLGTAVCATALLGALKPGTSFSWWWIPGLLSFGIGADGLSVFMATIAGVLGFLIVVYSSKYMEEETGQTRYYALVLLFIGGMIGLVLTTNLLILYFFWELVGLCSYALIGFEYRNPAAARAGIKAFLTTRIGDVGLFAGIMVLYYGTNPHTFQLPAILAAAARGGIPLSALAFAAFAMLAGAVGKSAQMKPGPRWPGIMPPGSGGK